jgi:hypothetical protein
VNPTREQLRETIFDCEIALRDELERYLAACRPLVRAIRDAEARVAYLDFVDDVRATFGAEISAVVERSK